MNHAVYLIRCPDRKGLLATITGFFFDRDLNVLHCQQYTDKFDGGYFMRIKIDLTGMNMTRKQLEKEFAELAASLELNYQCFMDNDIRNVAIMVSKTSHCLYDLLVQHQEGVLPCNIPFIVSNHPDVETVADKFRIPYYCFPVKPGKKAEQEAAILELFARHHIDLVVMARYMQVLSEDFINAYPSRIINIHHAFLPAFQGANPYQRAWERGVKMIGATAHFATCDLDEGPIIEQDVERISHEDDPDDMKQLGKEIERRVLTRAVKAYLENRIINYGRRTVVFSN